MARWISAELRETVADRAKDCANTASSLRQTPSMAAKSITLSAENTEAPPSQITLLTLARSATAQKEAMLDQLPRLASSRAFSIRVPIIGRNTFV